MNNDIVYDTLLTGDLIIFSGTNSIMSNIVQIATGSIWSHIGIVIKDPNFLIKSDGEKKGLYLLNSDGNYEIDIESETTKIGVQLVDLKKKIENYDGLIVTRHLLTNNERHNEEENNKRNLLFREAYQTVFDKSYDYIPLNLFVTFLHNAGYEFADNWINNRHTDYLFCSALTAYIYTVSGIMPKDTKWSIYTPDFFTKNSDDSFCFESYTLSPMITIKDSRIKINKIIDLSNNDLSNNDLSNNDLSNNDLSNNDLSNNDLSNNDLSNNDLSNNDLSNNDLSNNDLSNNDLSNNNDYTYRCVII
jgi:hypothetical protein